MAKDKPNARQALVQAAVEELSEHGFSGARVERVARRAGFNKALAYRYFGDRKGLFDEALRSKFLGRRALLDQLPERLSEALSFWFTRTGDDPDFMRLIQHEALSDRGEPPVEEAYRREYYAAQVAMVDAYQQRGAVDDAFDSTMLFYALLALVVFPVSFPQITRLVTGYAPDDPAFRERWAAMLTELAEHLVPAPDVR